MNTITCSIQLVLVVALVALGGCSGGSDQDSEFPDVYSLPKEEVVQLLGQPFDTSLPPFKGMFESSCSENTIGAFAYELDEKRTVILYFDLDGKVSCVSNHLKFIER